MKRTIFFLTILVCALSGVGQTVQKKQLNGGRAPLSASATVPAPARTSMTVLPIRKVVLYSNGVAYIERRGTVTGNAEINLAFKQSQVDDVLKSMVVLDLGQGKIGSVSYGSSMPASARTAEIPFSVDAETEESEGISGGLANVLGQLQGARVVVTSSRGVFEGAILTVEKRKTTPSKDDRPSLPSHALVIASASGDISSFDLADIRTVKLLDDGTKKDVNEFANATASTRRRDAKTITVTSTGQGQREMIVSYTVAAPIWKTTYRVVLDSEGRPFFQGWAIIDNVSEEDWQDVRLSLVSGSPVSFIQNLQKPLYRYRPIIPIPEDLNLKPQIYDPEIGEGTGSGAGIGSGMGGGSGSGGGDGDGGPPAQRPPMFSSANNNFIISSGYAGTSVSDAIITERSGVQTAATGEEIGDLFEYKIEQPVNVERNRSALIPIIQTKMEGERVSIFRDRAASGDEDIGDDSEDEVAAVQKANPRPMSGMLLKNVTAMTFEGGSLTVLDRDSYAGEALMERLKPKEQRLISFALDLGTLVRTEKKEDREPAKLVKVVAGVFQVHYFKTDKTVYKLSNQTDRPKTIYLEHPVRKDWVISDKFAKPDYTTARFYRFRIALKPFENREVVVGENLGMMDKYDLFSLSPKDLDLFVITRIVDDATRAKMAKLIDLRMQINQINAKMQNSAKATEEISKDQQRFRENIEALTKTPEAKALIARYIAKANDQESRLEQMEKERQTMSGEKERLERELATEIKNFEIK